MMVSSTHVCTPPSNPAQRRRCKKMPFSSKHTLEILTVGLDIRAAWLMTPRS